MPLVDFEPSGYADASSPLLLRTYRDRDANEKRMVGLSQKLGYLRKEAIAHNKKLGNNKKLEEI